MAPFTPPHRAAASRPAASAFQPFVSPSTAESSFAHSADTSRRLFSPSDALPLPHILSPDAAAAATAARMLSSAPASAAAPGFASAFSGSGMHGPDAISEEDDVVDYRTHVANPDVYTDSATDALAAAAADAIVDAALARTDGAAQQVGDRYTNFDRNNTYTEDDDADDDVTNDDDVDADANVAYTDTHADADADADAESDNHYSNDSDRDDVAAAYAALYAN